MATGSDFAGGRDLLAIGIVGSPGVPHHEPSSEEFMGVSRTKMLASLAATMKDQ
jgi:hypothetical protein